MWQQIHTSGTEWLQGPLYLYRTFQPQNISQNELYYLQFFRSTLPLNEIFNNSGFNQIFFTLLIKGNETVVYYSQSFM